MKTRRTLRAVAIGFLVAGACASVADAQGSTFSYGHIFVSVQEFKTCIEGFREAIIEVDPATGQWSVFADSDDGLCGANGLRFDPGGQRLLVLNSATFIPSTGWVQAFRADGTGEVILNGTDGLLTPFGANGLAFDPAGDLYVVDESRKILRFPGGAGPGEVFADADDGITGRGGLDFAPDGDLFYAAMDANAVMRITPDGEATVFDPLPVPSSLVFDRAGNLFVAGAQAGVGAAIYRYDNADVSTRRVLATGFVGISAIPLPITMSADDRHVYVVDQTPGVVYAVDAVDGTKTVIADLSQIPVLSAAGVLGIAVFAPASIPAVSLWGALWMSLLLIVAGTLVVGRRRLEVATRVLSPVSGER